MKIGVIGTRGFPGIQGGLETHCMELYTRLASMGGMSITVYRRTPYLERGNKDTKYENIRFIDIKVPKKKFLETILHTFYATLHSLFQHYDIIHFHNIGPGFFIPLARLSGAKVVFTFHNMSYTQKKWNNCAKRFLKFSEKISVKNSDVVIFISEVLKEEMSVKYSFNNFRMIPNGVTLPKKSTGTEYIESLGLEKNKYIVGVGRFLEEKGFDFLIRSYKKTGLTDYKLVLVGDEDYPTDYSTRLKSFAKENDIVLTGFIKDEKLNQIYTFAGLYVMSSFDEGLPIALLEALSYDIDVLVSNIPANLQVGLDKDEYFEAGNEDALKEKILQKVSTGKKRSYLDLVTTKYNWETIAKEVSGEYQKLLQQPVKEGKH